MKIMTSYNMAVGSAITFLSCIFGEYWYIFAAFLALNVIDYITGLMKSKFFNRISSVEGVKGIVKKLSYWIAIAVAFIIPETICNVLIDTMGVDASFLMLFGWFTVATFTINEARSVIENLVQMEVDVPEFLVKGLAVAEKIIEDAAESKLPKEKDYKVTKEVLK